MKKILKRCTAALTAGVLITGVFAHLMTRETYAYSFTGQDSNVTTDIKVSGFDTGVDYTRVHLGSGGSSGYGANRIINIVEGNFANNPGLSIEVMNIGTYSTSTGSIVNATKNFSDGNKTILASVNGDWMSSVQDLGISVRQNYYVSFSPMVLDGEIWCSQMSSQEKANADYYTLGMSDDRQLVIGKPKVRTTIKNTTTGVSLQADGLNRAPADNALYVYNNRLGTSNYIPTSSYEVAVRVTGSNKFMNNETITGTVIGLYASGTSSRQSLTNDVIVLSARGTKMSQLNGKFSIGDTVTVKSYLTQTNAGNDANTLWMNCEEAIGGQILVMKDGKINNDLTDTTQYPTNLVGVKADGSIMFAMVTSDHHGSREGLRYDQIPDFCQDVGFDTCFMLDGGGSTTMVTLDENENYVERACYSDGVIRNLWNAVALVYEPKLSTAIFDVDYYYNSYADLRNAFGYNESALFNHFFGNGIKEGRRASATFDIGYYINNNSDIKTAFGDDKMAAIQHFINAGYKEPRAVAPYEDLGAEFNATIDLASANVCIGTSESNVVATDSASESKIWKFTRNSDGSYTITNSLTNKVMSVSGSSYESGTNVVLSDSDGSNGQRFYIHKTIDGNYLLRAKCSPMSVVTVSGTTMQAGSNIVSYTSSSSNAQEFKINAVLSPEDMTFNVKDGSKLSIEETASGLYIFGIDADALPKDIIADLDNNCTVYKSYGSVNTGRLCTGDIVIKVINGKEAVRATLVVTGDTNCDGIVNGKDLIQAKKALEGQINKGYSIAADIDRDGTLEESDLSELTSLIK